MDRIEALKAFILVAEEGGFSRAAAQLGMSKSAASRQISALEAELGGRLLNRTTRHVELTEDGQAYLDRVRIILADLESANRDVAAAQNALSGMIRIASPVAFGVSRLGAIAAAFMARHPKLSAEIVLTDRLVEPGEEGFDLCLAIQPARGETDIGLCFAPVETGLFAAPEYLTKHGRPQAPGDLSEHPGLCVGMRSRQVFWHLRGASEPVAITPRLSSTHAGIVREAAVAGLGIALLPGFAVADDIKAGRLLRILDGFEPKPDWLCAFHPEGRVASAKVRLFTDFLVERFRRDGTSG